MKWINEGTHRVLFIAVLPQNLKFAYLDLPHCCYRVAKWWLLFWAILIQQ